MKKWILIGILLIENNSFSQEMQDSSKISNEIYLGYSYSPIYFGENLYLFNLLGKINTENGAYRGGICLEYPKKNRIGYFDIHFGGESIISKNDKLKWNIGAYAHLGYSEYSGNSIYKYYRDITAGISPFTGINIYFSDNISLLCETSISFSYINKKFPSHCKTPDCDFFYTDKKFIINPYKLLSIAFGYKL